MARRRVFVCYDDADREIFDQLLIQLDPYHRQDLIEIWTDQQIPVGAERETAIYRAINRADAAVVLISPDLLASDFVRRYELPRLLQAREEGRLLLVPLFLRSVAAHSLRIKFEGSDGGQEMDLGQIEGLNAPTQLLKALTTSERDQALADAIAKFFRALELLPEPGERPTRPRRELTAYLELRDDRIARRFGHPPYYDLYASYDPVDLRRLEVVARRSPDEMGQKLFELLLGPAQERQEVLSRAYGRWISDPLRHAFRIRIRTEDSKLRELPWSQAMWRHYRLVEEGWTFELAAGDEPRPVEHLRTPCRALIVTDENSDHSALLADAHARGFESLLRRAWGSPVKAQLIHRASTAEELEDELARPIDLLYVYAHADAGPDGLRLRLAAGSTVTLDQLSTGFANRPPRILVLNTIGDTPLIPTFPGAAVTVHLRHEDRGDRQHEARLAAAAWWESVLGVGLDPVRAYCTLPENVRSRGTIYTNYQEWRIDHSEYVPKVDRPRAHLDRRDQRRAVQDAVEDLVRGQRRRVTCIVAYGAERNLVDHFAMQIMATLKERARKLARLQHVRLELPKAVKANTRGRRPALTRTAIREHFRDTLSLQPSQALSAAFARQHRSGPRTKPVHFLDWGAYGPGHGAQLTSGDLEAWAVFCRDDLEVACPKTARILAYLCWVSDESRHAEVAKVVQALKKRHHRPHFDLIPLPALGTVTADDLRRFLDEPSNSSCPSAFLEDLPERIVRETEGSFEATVELLEDTEKRNRWYELIEELDEAPPEPELDKDLLL